ncbi:MAG TPA: hypothetical protein PLJ11_08655 [Methanomassiliicoccales archaeon]|nr:hypothetical protein [Methanomassiliicoccales archaeon]
MAKIKRGAIEQILKRINSTDPQYEWLRGSYDTLAQIIAEIEQIRPGIDREVVDVNAPTWNQRLMEIMPTHD